MLWHTLILLKEVWSSPSNRWNHVLALTFLSMDIQYLHTFSWPHTRSGSLTPRSKRYYLAEHQWLNPVPAWLLLSTRIASTPPPAGVFQDLSRDCLMFASIYIYSKFQYPLDCEGRHRASSPIFILLPQSGTPNAPGMRRRRVPSGNTTASGSIALPPASDPTQRPPRQRPLPAATEVDVQAGPQESSAVHGAHHFEVQGERLDGGTW